MQHLNYCRQLVKHCTTMLEMPRLDPELRAVFGNVIDLSGASTKFILPNGGRILDDKEYRALDETKTLRLPYSYVALEYECVGLNRPNGTPLWGRDGPAYEDDTYQSAPKRVVFARERNGFIVLTIAFWTQHNGTWRVLPECAIPQIDYLDRSANDKGRVPVKFGVADNRFPLSDYMDEIGAILCFLNAMQCSNVHVERSESKKSGKKVKSAHQFDTYHVLTVDIPNVHGIGKATGGHRSPREHLRRGHIRRLSDERKIWVNASVVGAGHGSGKITKDYLIRCASYPGMIQFANSANILRRGSR